LLTSTATASCSQPGHNEWDDRGVTSPLWDAPLARGSVLADVRVPGSKSMTNRALVLGALAPGRSRLHRPLRSRDTAIMVAALRALGTAVDDTDEDSWLVDGGPFTTAAAQVDVGNAGTVLRFVPPLAALSSGLIGFDGDIAARQRPVGPLLAALRDLGADIEDGGRGFLPFAVRGQGGVRGGELTLDASSSSQLVSALLLAGAAFRDGVDIRHVGARAVPNAPHLAMTVAMLAERGVAVSADQSRWTVSPGSIAALDTFIEPDLSSAAPFAAAAVVTGGEVRIRDWPVRSTQPGAMLPGLLERFGATATVDDGGLVVRGAGTVIGADLDLRDAGELTPVLAAIAVVASSPSRLVGIDYLRGHETDRLAALARELSALGADVRELPDGLAIVPKPLRGTVFSTYDDHRMAMAAAVVGLVVSGVQVENIATTAKTLPDFAAMWAAAFDGQGATR
jgi:3-phosphoshikimate 1-carboxyvinyltransferase